MSPIHWEIGDKWADGREAELLQPHNLVKEVLKLRYATSHNHVHNELALVQARMTKESRNGTILNNSDGAFIDRVIQKECIGIVVLVSAVPALLNVYIPIWFIKS